MSLNKLLSETNIKVFQYVGDKITINSDKTYEIKDNEVEEVK